MQECNRLCSLDWLPSCEARQQAFLLLAALSVSHPLIIEAFLCGFACARNHEGTKRQAAASRKKKLWPLPPRCCRGCGERASQGGGGGSSGGIIALLQVASVGHHRLCHCRGRRKKPF
jgi:hypothetical protein